MIKMINCFFLSFVLLIIISFFVNFSVAEAMDSDYDGWSNYYEEKLGSDPNDPESIPTSLADPDQDGLSTEQEKKFGTDPIDPDTDNDNLSDGQEVAWKISDPCDPDTDNDGLDDFNEVLRGTNPRAPDSDGDGWLDKAEIDAGSDPKNHLSTPKISAD